MYWNASTKAELEPRSSGPFNDCCQFNRHQKNRRLNIRLSSKDLEAIQKRALAEGLPYQTLISSLLHKYASGGLHGRRDQVAAWSEPDVMQE